MKEIQIYTIDMDKDAADEITFLSDEEQVLGDLRFSYLQEEVDDYSDEFAAPRLSGYRATENGTGILWSFELSQKKSRSKF